MRVVAFIALLFAWTGCDALFGLRPVPGQGSATGDAPGDTDSGSGLRTDATIDAPIDAFVQKTCVELGYTITISGSLTHYRPGVTPLTWVLAEADCEDDSTAPNAVRTHLVVLSDDVEASNVYSMVLGSAGDFWIGLSDRRVANNFRWVTDEVTGYPAANTGSPWQTGEPSGGVGEDCVRDTSQVRMYDTGCSNVLPFACECDSFVPDKLNY